MNYSKTVLKFPTPIPIPIFRFFSKEPYAKKMVDTGEVYFNTIKAFTVLKNDNFRDSNEDIYNVKTVDYMYNSDGTISDREFAYSIGSAHRKIEDAWAFCATHSNCSIVKKDHCVVINNLPLFISLIGDAIRKKFNKELVILFGPVAYNDKNADTFSKAIPAPYFTKDEEFKNDLEYRIVIIPEPEMFNNGKLEPLILKIENGSKVMFKDIMPTPKK